MKYTYLIRSDCTIRGSGSYFYDRDEYDILYSGNGYDLIFMKWNGNLYFLSSENNVGCLPIGVVEFLQVYIIK